MSTTSCLGHYALLPDNCIPTLSQQIERRRKTESRTAQETPCKDTKRGYRQRRHHERVLLFDHDSAQFLFSFVHWPQPQGGMRLALINLRHLCPVPICQGNFFSLGLLIFSWASLACAGVEIRDNGSIAGTVDAVLFWCIITVDAI